jgi:CRP/FNR family transcriptional regulator, polysaccharide utilization system transcription regulator
MHQRRTLIPDPKCDECGSRNSSVFSELVPVELRVLSTSKTCHTYSRGEVIFYTGDRPSGLHCIHQGKVKVCKNGPDTREQIIRLAGPGDIMGYRSLLGGSTYSSFAVALEECRVCFIPRAEFASMIATQPNLSMRLMTLLSSELRTAERKMVEFAQKSSRERLAETLLLLETKYGCEEDGETLAAKLSREELAGLVGTVTESVIRLLSDLAREGVIDIDRRRIGIVDRNRLVAIAKISD